MGHNLEKNHGKTSMMYVGKKPWHGLGQYLGENAVTANEAIEAAGLNWDVKLVDIKTVSFTDIPNHKAVVREDTNTVLSVVGKRYTPYQNSEAFKILDPFVGQDKAVWHTAGVLGQGETIWVLAKLPNNIEITNGDIIDKYLLLSNSHDGTKPIQLKFTPVRVVCQNTLKMAMFSHTDINQLASIKHTKNYKSKITETLKLFGLVEKYTKEFEVTAKTMYQTKMTDEEIDTYIADVLEIVDEARKKTELYKNTRFSKIRDLVETGIGVNIGQVKGSLWGTYNAVTESIDHTDRKIKDRMNYMMFAAGNTIKDRAWKKAKKLILKNK